MRRTRGAVAAVTMAVAMGGVVAACSSSSGSGAQGGGGTDTARVSAASTQAATVAPPPTATAPAPTAPATTTSAPPQAADSGGAATVSAAGVPTALDPCQLVPGAEASALAGVTYGAGTEETAGLSKRCTYGAQTTNVLTVEAAQATDATAAQAAWDQAESEVNADLQQQLPPGINATLNKTDVPGIGDRATVISATATIAGRKFGISGIYVLKGAEFFAFQDFLAGNPPTASALEAEAQKALGRL